MVSGVSGRWSCGRLHGEGEGKKGRGMHRLFAHVKINWLWLAASITERGRCSNIVRHRRCCDGEWSDVSMDDVDNRQDVYSESCAGQHDVDDAQHRPGEHTDHNAQQCARTWTIRIPWSEVLF